MKRILFLYGLMVVAIYCNSQEKEYLTDKEPFLYEKILRKEFLEKYNYPNRELSTDSVYSFFRSFPFKPFGKERVLMEVEDEPLAFDTVQNQIIRNIMLSSLRNWYEDNPENKEERPIPTHILREILSLTIDSTTYYTVPITHWNASLLGPQYITASNTTYFKTLTRKRFMKWYPKKFEKFRNEFFMVHTTLPIKMSVPVFDKQYRYAFMVFNMGDEFDNNGYCFAIFRRQQNEWEPIYVTRKRKGYHAEPDFKGYLQQANENNYL